MDRTLDKKIDADPVTGLPIGKLVDENPPAEWPVAKTIQGASVRLEPLALARHGESLWNLTGGLHNATLWQYMAEGPFEDRITFDSAMLEAASQEDPIFYAIVDQISGQAVGRASLLNIRPKHRSIEIGHLLLSGRIQRTRGATEAIYLLMRYAFEDLHYRRCEWKCNALNQKSVTAAKRLGFRFEGLFRQHLIIKGRSRDSAWFSMLASEWPAAKQAMEAWLEPENFDEAGLQIHSLRDFMPATNSDK